MDIQNKTHIRITGDGYLINPDYPIYHQELPFGEIVRRNMSAYHKRQSKVPLERLADVGQPSFSDKFARLKRATNLAKTGGIRARIDEAIKYLPLLMDNRAEFLMVFSTNLSTLFSNPIEVKNIWNTAEKKIVQELYVLDLDDLLLYDIGKVILQIFIFFLVPIAENTLFGNASRKDIARLITKSGKKKLERKILKLTGAGNLERRYMIA